MPRTVEHIVDCHIAAAELRKAGKPIWANKINIKQHLSEDTADEDIVKAAKGILAEMERVPVTLRDEEYCWVIEEFSEIVECVHDPEDNEYLLEAFNEKLDRLYDWADFNRVWCGL